MALNSIRKESSVLKTVEAYRYDITLQYLHTDINLATTIKNESLKSLIIDHNYDTNCMPTMYANLRLDKSLVDNMIKHQNDNLMIVALYKYDSNAQEIHKTLCFRKKFIYFLPDNVNRMDPIDYNEITEEEMKGNTYTSLTLGLLCLDHVNANKHRCEITATNTKQYDVVKYLVSHMKNLIIEPFTYNDRWKQLIIPSNNANSVNKALKFLNNQKVFYSTPYRYYQDYDYTYIISSAGKEIHTPTDRYSSILLAIKDVDNVSANHTGLIINKTTGTYEVHISYANTQVYDNTLINKSKTVLRGITGSGANDASLTNTASYGDSKIVSMRLDNDNAHMIENIEAKMNSENFLLYFSKNDLDTNLFTLNKRISIHNIDRYREYNGTYLLYRKREVYIREDTSFTLSSMINLKRIELDTNIVGVETTQVSTIKTEKKPNVTVASKNSYAANVGAKIQQQKPQTTSGSIFIPSSLRYYKSNR